jgi:TRAP-type C4-dicarboxylate transport system substrate-binding protein
MMNEAARNADKYAQLAREDYLTKNPQAVSELESHGMTHTKPDLPDMRKKLAPYYARWRKQFGDKAWALLEQTCGNLG